MVNRPEEDRTDEIAGVVSEALPVLPVASASQASPSAPGPRGFAASCIPPLSWPGWAAVAAPLRAHLATPRTWAELQAWGRAHGWTDTMLTNVLAYLEEQHQVVSSGGGPGALWAARSPADETAPGSSRRTP